MSNAMQWHGKTHWLGCMPWARDIEGELLDWSAKPQYLGLVKGHYYSGATHFSGRWGHHGHTGLLEVVVDDQGKILFVEFNEKTMENYYVRYFQGVWKRRSEYGFFQNFHDHIRSAKSGAVTAKCCAHVEQQILETQRLDGEYDLVSGASFSVKNMLHLTRELDKEIKEKRSDTLYYGYAEDFGYGITGWLQVRVKGGKIIVCFYDEILADYPEEIKYDELKEFYRLSKYHSQGFEEPFAPGWDRETWLVDFKTLSDTLNAHVCETQDLLDVEGLPHADGEDLGTMWDRESRPDGGIVHIKSKLDLPPRPRHPSYNNYLRLAEHIHLELMKDGVLALEEG